MKINDNIKAKIHTMQSIESELKKWRENGERIVFTNGCFDLLHLGHINYLADAAELGNRLIIGVNTDASVSSVKGPHRPLKDENSRSIILAALQFTDAIILFDEETPINLISHIAPDVLVKGGDYTLEQIVGHELVLDKGGKVLTIPITEGYSTTNIEQKILDSKS
jgi:D-glycero-beta-D-manno-heptose 1-phosphate adenylyltransferase